MYYLNFFRNNITRLIDSWETLKKSKNKDSKAAEKSREEFKKKGEQVFWIGKDNININLVYPRSGLACQGSCFGLKS